ncbi:hypothetical protein FA15DRAFT_668751 [Coprinopsis marcescibilis]|uniref:C2H2-type domain-containing protein n=1 Tax=Coprinopsis marcescibilis TaxID=230819 RepID=A0A5C3KYF1_COPMA|nr:hypothetical protein FA15DRAFT_668751 [Coprinopsis marcescibilis]
MNPETEQPRALGQWDDIDDEDYDEEESSSSDSDIDAEAQEMARRLGEQLWADLNPKETGEIAQPASNPGTLVETNPEAQLSNQVLDIPMDPDAYKKAEESALATIATVLHLVAHDPGAKALLSSTGIPGFGSNVLEVLQQSASLGRISKGAALPLSQMLVSLARSEQLFGNLRHSDASAAQLQQGKRKRDDLEDDNQNAARFAKRPFAPEEDFQRQVTEAVRTILQAFASTTSTTLDPSLIASIRLQLHQVFLFAVTSSARGGPEMHPLQEVSGLIQVVGVLSGIQIGQGPEAGQPPGTNQYPPGSYPWIPGHGPPPVTDIGTAVYPCLISGCKKTFARLYNLRAHQRNHAIHRPFRCTVCPASFARNHDLKRHIKLHDRKAWKCASCQKIFSRRDAFKRHTNSSKTRGPRGDLCTDADVIEVELNDDDSNETHREERRVKLWSGISSGSVQGVYRDTAAMEEGEIHETIIMAIQGSVMTLHAVLQSLVGNVLGFPAQTGLPAPAMSDPAGSQATLASVIARAQSQSIPSAHIPEPSITHPTPEPAETVSEHSMRDVQMEDISMDGGQGTSTGSNALSLQPLTMYGLSDEQTQLLELAIANAALAAQAQAEAEAAMEEEDDDDDDEDDEDADADGDEDEVEVEDEEQDQETGTPQVGATQPSIESGGLL